MGAESPERVADFMRQAAARRLERAPAEARERRREVDRRNEELQKRPIRRGPNAHKDGTFGKLRPEPKGGGGTT